MRSSERDGRRRIGALLATVLGGMFVLSLLAWRDARMTDPVPTLLLRDRHGRFVAEIRELPRTGARPADDRIAGSKGGDQGAGRQDESGPLSEPEAGYWSLPALPARVVAATLAVEDRRFRVHPGIDPAAVGRALWQNLRSGRRRSGASTIAMQVARMEHPGPRDYPHKASEALRALLMTARYGRERVLSQYLRLAPYGNCIHGIGYAARRYLDKPVEDLSWAETAFLAAIPQAPGRMNPFRPEGRAAAIARGRQILDLLRARGDLDTTECALAQEQIGTIAFPPPWRRPPNALHLILRWERALQDPKLRTSFAPRNIVDLTLDLDLQRLAAARLAEHLRTWESRGAGNAALMVVDPSSREVLASIGSSGYFDENHAGAIDYTRVLRSPGSLLKPFLYADALERGVITPATILDDVERGTGSIADADERFLGPMLPRVALANSRNVPAVDLLARLGCAEGGAFLEELGFPGAPAAVKATGLGIAVGGMPVTLEDVVRAYTVLSTGGLGGDLVWYGRPGGSASPETDPGVRRVLSQETARQITLFLSDPMARLPSFPRMGPTEFPFPVAVKTGTSTSYRDAWTVAYSKRYLVGAWVGHPSSRPMDRVSGVLSAATLTRDVMLALHPAEAEGLDDLAFPPPEGFVARRICALTGKLATPACGQVFLEWFARGEEPVDPCTAHRWAPAVADCATGAGAEDGRSAGGVAGAPHGLAFARPYLDLPPRYAAWVAHEGLAPPQSPRDRDPGPGRGARIRVTQPEDGMRLMRDPESPPEQSTIALQAVVDPPASAVIWYIDGAPYQSATYPYTARWQLRPGEHTIEARVAGSVSNQVRLQVE